MMVLFDSSSSPFVRKVNLVIHLLGLESRIERRSQNAHPVARDAALVRHNPLGQAPTLLREDGRVLCDSRVVCEYLDSLAGGGLFPPAGDARWQALLLQSLADGLLDAGVLLRYEGHTRPPPQRWQGWVDAQWTKIDSVLDHFEQDVIGWGARVDIGTLTAGCALGYLDFRFEDVDWRAQHPCLAQWYAPFAQQPAMQATWPRPRMV